jgi:hypothetical protein
MPPVSAGTVRVRVFTEPAPVRILAAAGKFVFVGTDRHLERWDDGGGVLPLSAEHGLPGTAITALATDPERRGVWILTDGGLGYYDAAREAFRELPAPAPALAVDFAALARDGASLAPAADGVWIGASSGLHRATLESGWVPTSIRLPVRALARDRGGWLWIATQAGLFAHTPTGAIVPIGAAEGCAITDPRLVVEVPGGRALVIGTDESGRERVAIGHGLAWATYRALPEVRWDAAAYRASGVVVMGGDRLYRIRPHDGSVRPLSREGLRLVPVSGGAASDWVIDPLDAVPPPGATSLGAADDQLLIGTRELGTARYRDGDARPHDWLRRRQMVRDATTLSVACARAEDCWIATGARRAWHWNGARFEAGGPDHAVLAVLRDPGGAIYALHRAPAEPALRLSRIERGAWVPVPGVAIAALGSQPAISFARFAEAGSLWVGLRAADGDERSDAGIAIVDVATGRIAYHRADPAADRRTHSPRAWPVPPGIADAEVRGDTAWLATAAGVARLADGELTTWAPASGSPGAAPRAVAIAADGSVFVATSAGASRWDGRAWELPDALQFDINDVATTRTGQLWMATDRGIAAWDGTRVRRLDTRRGLAENHILDIATDQFDRLWARGPGSLTLISQ